MLNKRLRTFLAEAKEKADPYELQYFQWVTKNLYLSGFRHRIIGVLTKGCNTEKEEYVMRVAGVADTLEFQWIYGYIYSKFLRRPKWGCVPYSKESQKWITRSEAKLKIALLNL